MRTIMTIAAAIIAVAVLALPSAAAAPEQLGGFCVVDAQADLLQHQADLAAARTACDMLGAEGLFRNAFLRPENPNDNFDPPKCAVKFGSIWRCFGV